MILAVTKETKDRERRVALTPEVVQTLIKAGYEVRVQSGAGLNAYYEDSAYEKPGLRYRQTANRCFNRPMCS